MMVQLFLPRVPKGGNLCFLNVLCLQEVICLCATFGLLICQVPRLKILSIQTVDAHT